MVQFGEKMNKNIFDLGDLGDLGHLGDLGDLGDLSLDTGESAFLGSCVSRK